MGNIDFQSLFESAPGLYLILLPDLTIVAVSDAYLNATMTIRKEIIGRGIFDVFPDNPDDPNATGESNSGASLNSVLQFKKPHTMAIQKYDIRRPDGTFEERYWSPLNTPVLDEEKNVKYIIHCVVDVTQQEKSKVQLRRADDEINEGSAFYFTLSQNLTQ
ncbi:MAG: sensor histidine kinase [Bacteroidota bacterium]|nr:sensor histidine kinase [Bacteroidota bacterium]